MTRDERLKFCLECTLAKRSLEKGVICGLTNEIAAFEGTCESFDRDLEKQKAQAIHKQIEQLEDEAKDPPWRIALTVILVLFAIIRIIMRLSR